MATGSGIRRPTEGDKLVKCVSFENKNKIFLEGL
jgi:hypothetical protein